MAISSNIENLVDLANRIADLPDSMLAEITKQEGIEPVLAATEIKDRSDMRAEAQAQPRQDPTVIDALIQKLMGAPQSPMGMTPDMMMAQQQQGVPQGPPLPMMPERMQPELAPELLAQQLPMARVGGLIRKFANGSQGIPIGQPATGWEMISGYGLNPTLENAIQEMYGLTPQQYDESGIPMSHFDMLRRKYEAATDPASQAAIDAYNLGYESIPTSGININRDVAREKYGESAERSYLSKAGLESISGDPLLTGGQIVNLGLEGGRRGQERPYWVAQGEDIPQFYPDTPRPSATLVSTGGVPPASNEDIQLLRQLYSPQEIEGLGRDQIDSLVEMAQSGTQPDVPPDGAGTDDPVIQQRSVIVDPYDVEETTTQGLAASGSLAQIAAEVEGSYYDKSLDYGIGGSIVDRLQLGIASEATSRGLKFQKMSDDALEELERLKGEIPDTQSIIDSNKQQMRFGLAQAFLSGSKKPDFMSAMGETLANAAGVMGSMTAKQQKELMQYAVDMYKIEATEADAFFNRQAAEEKKASDELNRMQTTRIAIDDSRLKRSKYANDHLWKQVQMGLDLATLSADQQDKMRDDTQKASTDWLGKVLETSLDTWKGLQTSQDQWEMKFGIDLDAIGRNVVGAQKAVNIGLSHMVRETQNNFDRLMNENSDAYNQASDAEKNAIRRRLTEQANGAYRQSAINEGRLGHLAVYDRFMPVISQASGLKDGPQQLKDIYRWMDVSIF